MVTTMKKLFQKILATVSSYMTRHSQKALAIREDVIKTIARNCSAEIRRKNLLAINPIVFTYTGVEPKENRQFVKWVFQTTDWKAMNQLQEEYVMSSKANSQFPEISAQFTWAGMVIGIHLDHLQRIGEGLVNPLSKDFFTLWQIELAHDQTVHARPSAANSPLFH